jgi:PST family polysaccharide transporter
VQNDPILFSQYYCRTVRLIAFLTAPGIALLCALPREIIVLLLGAQWVDSARIFEIFAYASLLQPVTVTAGWLYLSLGNTRRMVWWSTANSVIAVCAFAAGLPWGAVGVAWATAGCMYVMFIPCMAVAMWKTPVRAVDVVSSVWRAYVLASVIFAAAVAMRIYMQGSHPLVTIIAASAAAAAAALALIAVWPALRRELLAVGGMLRHLRSTKAQVAAST